MEEESLLSLGQQEMIKWKEIKTFDVSWKNTAAVILRTQLFSEIQ